MYIEPYVYCVYMQMFVLVCVSWERWCLRAPHVVDAWQYVLYVHIYVNLYSYATRAQW